MPKVSIIVPVHNTEPYLEKCVKSLMIQTLEDIEIILVENASTDGSLALCYKLAEADERIKVLSLERGDVSAARNTGIQHSLAPFVAFVDSDDYVAPNMYEELYNFAIKENLELVTSNWVGIYENRPPRYPFEESGKAYIFSSKEMIEKNFKAETCSSMCTTLYSKSLFDKIKFPEGQRYEDRAISYRMIDLVERVGYIAKALYYYCQRQGSIVYTRIWINYYGFAYSDVGRLKFLRDSERFTYAEKIKLAKYPTDSFLRKLRHLFRLAQSAEEKELTLEIAKNIDLIPKGTKMSLKGRIIRIFVKSKL